MPLSLRLAAFILNWDPPKHHRVKENSVSLSDSSKLQGLKRPDLWNHPDIVPVHVSWFLLCITAVKTLTGSLLLQLSWQGDCRPSPLLRRHWNQRPQLPETAWGWQFQSDHSPMRCRVERTMYLTPIITMETPPKDTSDLGVSWGGGLVSPLQRRGFRQLTDMCLEMLRTRWGALTKVVGKYFLRRDSEHLRRTEEEESWRVTDPPSPYLMLEYPLQLLSKSAGPTWGAPWLSLPQATWD